MQGEGIVGDAVILSDQGAVEDRVDVDEGIRIWQTTIQNPGQDRLTGPRSRQKSGQVGPGLAGSGRVGPGRVEIVSGSISPIYLTQCCCPILD